MANMFNEDGTYNKTEWKTGDKITAVKLNKIESSLEAINNNDIDRHVEADTRLDALEESIENSATKNELKTLETLVKDNKDTADLEFYKFKGRVNTVEGRVDTVEGRVDTVEGRVDTVEGRVDTVEGRVDIINDEILNVKKQFVTPEMFGAVGDAISDDSEALRRAFEYGGDVILSPKIYKSNKQLVIPSNTTIHGNNATIIFTNNQTMTGGYDYGYVVNEYSSYLYNEIRSKNIKIENITFKKENICEIEKAFLLLTNVENVVLNNVNIECLNVGDKINSLDILLNCRNIRVNNCKFTHAQSNVVGGVWVRNRMTYEKYEPTKDIVFTNCLFKRRGGIDEVLAIFTSNSYNGVHSTVEDVSVNGCTFICEEDPVYDSSPYLIMITNPTCYNIKFNNCMITHNKVAQAIFKTKPGTNNTGDNPNTVEINNCKIYALGVCDNSETKRVFFHEDCKNVFRVRGCSINIDADVMLGNDTIFMNSVITSSSNVAFSSECTFYNSIIDLYSNHPYISQNGIKLYNSEVNIESSVNDLVVTLHIYDIVNSRIKSNTTILLQIVSDKFKIIDIKNNIITCDKEVKIQNTLDGSKCPIFIIDNNYINGSNIFILSSNTKGIKQNIACSNNIFHAKYTSLPDKILLSVNNHTLS